MKFLQRDLLAWLGRLPWLARKKPPKRLSPQPPRQEAASPQTLAATLPAIIDAPLLGGQLRLTAIDSFQAGRLPYKNSQKRMLFNSGATRYIFTLEQERVFMYGEKQNAIMACAALQVFFRQLAAEVLPAYVHALAKMANYEQTDVFIRNPRLRWGSCSRRQAGQIARINLNWRAVLLPCDLIRHLCCHELAHLRQMNHSAAFYRELELLSPQSKEKERALNKVILPDWADWRLHKAATRGQAHGL